MNQSRKPEDVLTLEEAASFLRLPEDAVRRMAERGEIPARRLGADWRFLKAALAECLRGSDGRHLLLRQAGALADDETLANLRKLIYKERGRPERARRTRR
jgi:excisionase family DNA binding protein